MKQKPKILVIVGPTASGKSALAVKLAKKYNGEIISADSRQVYRGMDIGTGKIGRREMRGVPHHLLDVASPKRRYTVSNYVRDAERVIGGIFQRGKLPVICGGTGFYIRALVDKLKLPDVPPNKALRKRLEKKDVDELFKQLKRLDPVFALRIDRYNPRRLVRAIEIARALGHVPPLEAKTHYDPLFIGITFSTEMLAKRIHRRLHARIKAGMLNEVKGLRRRGVSWKQLEEFGLEYRFCSRHLEGKISKAEMLSHLEVAIRQYAKRQMTWFKKDKRIHWVTPAQKTKASRLIKTLLYS
ncbi:MAG: tRNA (adenosine(37)-N6)-dimethylallyltransferase MiaA [Candidatus Lloydbacteria bacterium RIFCSPHIGHO2_02_FULL_50_13]|uniref:tRNA dimethylallyltransferase n=1 Tax=Candidatus Lloydbacteria bacterium RIFCSPHIGHO2_02_FULL_50_13 TaxID=1798661 RepID=A0A1G2D278_9BACT|nr:MAG: tRNA (adenosine(37)-N6)-dimethylallyltransferase MiaA [Candidatus Lloydbacteria bacterium RIFCSPHIGHO2_02_FULL_50_13]